VIAGSLRNVPLADVFQIVVSGRKSGVLEVDADERHARIYFESGTIQYASLTPGVHLGEVLVRMDLLTAREVQTILAAQAEENAGAPLGHTAVRLGLLDDADLARALQRQITEVVADLIGWRDGEFAFSERDVLRTYVPTGHHVDAMMVLLEVAGHYQDEGAARVGPTAVFERAGDPTAVPLPDGAWEVLSHVDGKRSARVIASEVDLPTRQTFRVLASLEESGVIARVPFPVEEPLVLLASPSRALQRLLRLTVERVGARASIAEDGAATLASVAAQRPKAIVVDVSLTPDAWSTVRSVRQVDGLAHVPLLVLGADAGGVLARWRRARSDTMEKPFDELELQQWLMRRLGRALT
jgi:CheY-like chemotaxis protein